MKLKNIFLVLVAFAIAFGSTGCFNKAADAPANIANPLTWFDQTAAQTVADEGWPIWQPGVSDDPSQQTVDACFNAPEAKNFWWFVWSGTDQMMAYDCAAVREYYVAFQPEAETEVITPAESIVAAPTVSCITTAEAKEALNLDVQRLGTEQCSWTVRIPEGSSTFTASLSDGWMATVTESDGAIVLYYGEDGLEVSGWAATFRKLSGFSADDAVHVPCDLLKKEQDFGASEVPSFKVEPGNFTCG